MAETTARSFRVDDPIWFNALARAQREGVTLTSVLVWALIKYGEDDDVAAAERERATLDQLAQWSDPHQEPSQQVWNKIVHLAGYDREATGRLDPDGSLTAFVAAGTAYRWWRGAGWNVIGYDPDDYEDLTEGERLADLLATVRNHA